MRKNFLKSIGAGLAGIVIGAVLSIVTDKLLESFGVLPHGNLWTSSSIIALVLFYRCVYNILGGYIVARLAPSNPMRHALVVGIIGTAVSIGGAVATANMNLGPAWYGWTLAVLMLPTAWLGGVIYARGVRLE